MSHASAREAFDLKSLRSQYPALRQEIDGKRLVYLDSACTALKPKRVADRLSDFYAHWGGCGGKRSTHLLSRQVEAWHFDARRCSCRRAAGVDRRDYAGCDFEHPVSRPVVFIDGGDFDVWTVVYVDDDFHYPSQI